MLDSVDILRCISPSLLYDCTERSRCSRTFLATSHRGGITASHRGGTFASGWEYRPSSSYFGRRKNATCIRKTVSAYKDKEKTEWAHWRSLGFCHFILRKLWLNQQQKIQLVNSILLFCRSAFSDEDQEKHRSILIIGFITIVLLIYQVTIEFRQFVKADKKEFFLSIVNWLDVFQYISAIFIICLQLLEQVIEIPVSI